MQNNLKTAREKEGLTQQECADLFGVKLRTWQTYERGINQPKFEVLCEIADKFGTTTDYLIGRPDAPEPLKRPETLEEVVNMLDMDILMSGLYNILDDQKRRELSAAMTTLVERQREREEAESAEKDADKDQEPTETTDKQASASAV